MDKLKSEEKLKKTETEIMKKPARASLKDLLLNKVPEVEKKDSIKKKDSGTLGGATIETIVTGQEKETIEENEDNKEESLDNMQVSFFNLISYLLSMVNKNFHAGNTLDCVLFQKVMKFKNIENLSEIYSSHSDLIVEMIQGTDIENFKKFYCSGLPKDYKYF